jgi:UDPglucose 6-dehydrogenase
MPTSRSVAVVGAGYVGVTTGAALARWGHEVTLVDLDADRVTALREGTVPFHEPGLEDLLDEGLRKDRIRATTDLEQALDGAEVVMLAVGTPSKADGSIDLTQVEGAARDVGRSLPDEADYPVVTVKSTVTPGTTRDVVRPILEEESGRTVGEDLGVAVNPEFLREGNAVDDALRPDRVVVGADDQPSAEVVWDLYATLDCPTLEVDPTTAEFIKYAANALLATKITFANEMARVAEEVGVDVYDVMEGVGFDHRIRGSFLRAGAGFGGSCFPKDVAAIAHVARSVGAESGLLESVLDNFEEQPLHVVDMLEAAVGDLVGKRVALLGLSFKPGTDDVRNTRALPILEGLRERGADVVVHDPQAVEEFRALAGDVEAATSAGEALGGADACVVQTAWPAYEELGPEVFLDRMREPLVVDGRRTLDPSEMWSAGVDYRAVGLGRGTPGGQGNLEEGQRAPP